MNTFAITATSAIETLDICIRQSVKDSRKIYNAARAAYEMATSDDAIATYRTVIDITQHPWQQRQPSPILHTYQTVIRAAALIGMLAVLCWTWCREQIDALVEWAEQPVTNTEESPLPIMEVTPETPVEAAVVEEVCNPSAPIETTATEAPPVVTKRKRGRPVGSGKKFTTV